MSLRFCYCTDLHGNISKYEAVYEYCSSNKIKLLNIGADILPKGAGILDIQKTFITKYLKEYYEKCKKEGIEILASFGNDDLYSRKKYFKKYATLLDEVPYIQDALTFKAYSMVCDYPFGLKDACKWDSEGWRCPDPYISAPVTYDDTGRHLIFDIEYYFKKKGTIEEDLRYLTADSKTIITMHMPPAGIDLDVCYGGRKVGSKAIYDFIERTQPLLTLHGHIHESPEVSGTWMTKIGKSTVIQPGQREGVTSFVDIRIEEETVEVETFNI